LGIPRSVFLGRVPDDGEPYWTDLDRAYALAWQAEQRETHTCGQPLPESTAKENQFKYEAEPVRCHACAARDRIAEQYRGQDGADTAGLMVRLTRTPHGPVG
jgi:hypothetical protein